MSTASAAAAALCAWSSAIDRPRLWGSKAWPALSRNRQGGGWPVCGCVHSNASLMQERNKMLFGKLLPREGNFFEMFNQHADRIVEGARLLQLVQLQRPAPARAVQPRRDNAERAADRVTHEVNRLLHKTFITPIDRDQIHKLINTMDDVADLIQDSAETMALYDVRAHDRGDHAPDRPERQVLRAGEGRGRRCSASWPTRHGRGDAEDLRGDRPARVRRRPRDALGHAQAVPRGAGRARGDQAARRSTSCWRPSPTSARTWPT